jgi:hypothetical protein
MGDQSFYDVLTSLASVPQPLMGSSSAAITEVGVRVLDGRADHVQMRRREL